MTAGLSTAAALRGSGRGSSQDLESILVSGSRLKIDPSRGARLKIGRRAIGRRTRMQIRLSRGV